jgi:PhnB protein
VHIQPYLFFDGRCDEALDFYRRTLGAEVTTLMRFEESPEPTPVAEPEAAKKVMHAEVRIGETTVMVSDGRCTGRPEFRGFALTLSVADEADVDRLFAALGEGGEVRMPLAKTFFSPRFGIVADKFGVTWMVIAPV